MAGHPQALGSHGINGESSAHELKDAPVRGIVYTLAGLALMAALVGGLVYGIFAYLADNPQSAAPPNPMAVTGAQQFPPEPRIEDHPAVEIQQIHQMEDKILGTYGWTDKSRGIVRIPIDKAMDLQLERGFPTRKEGTQ